MRQKKSLPIRTVRLITEKRIMSEEILDNPDKVTAFLRDHMSDFSREVVMALFMDSAFHPIAMHMIGAGGITGSIASAQQLFQAALLNNASNLILYHNHPSGNLCPSKDDKELTKRIIACGNLLEINVADHIIIGGGRHRSMKTFGDVEFTNNLSTEKAVAEIKSGMKL